MTLPVASSITIEMPVQVSGFKVLVLFPLFVFLSIRSPHYHIIQLITFVYLLSY